MSTIEHFHAELTSLIAKHNPLDICPWYYCEADDSDTSEYYIDSKDNKWVVGQGGIEDIVISPNGVFYRSGSVDGDRLGSQWCMPNRESCVEAIERISKNG